MDQAQKENQFAVAVYVAGQEFEHTYPYRGTSLFRCRGSGAIIADQFILTNAHVGEGSTYIQVGLAKDDKRYHAEIAYLDHHCDLSLLTVADPEFWENTRALELHPILPVEKQEVTVIGFPIGGSVSSTTKGIISRIERTEYVHSKESMLSIQVDAAINSGNSGGPAISDDKLVGIAYQGYNNANNIGYIIPVPVIKHFLEDYALDKNKRGFPTLAIKTESLKAKKLRDYFSLQPDQTGIKVKKVEKISAAYDILQVDDILLSINGHSISDHGNIYLENGHPVDYRHIIDMAHIGDQISLQILRNNEILTKEITLINKSNNIALVPRFFDQQPVFWLQDGILFQVLTRNVIYSAHEDLEKYKKDFREKPSDQIVIINRIFPHAKTEGFDEIRYDRVEKINDQEINNIHDAIRALHNNLNTQHEIRVSRNDLIVIEKFTPQEHMDLLAKFYIQTDRSRDLEVPHSSITNQESKVLMFTPAKRKLEDPDNILEKRPSI